MKKLAFALVAIALTAPVSAQVHVRGYTRKDGTYVAPHERTAPNSTKVDNYSSYPNVNPYTGKQGTIDPYTPTPAPSYTPTCYFNCKK